MRLLVLGLLVLLGGCSGCRRDEQLSKKELEERARQRQEDLVVDELVSVPPDIGAKILHVKGGHWVETQQQYKSNREDLQVMATGTILVGDEEVMLPATNFVNSYARRTSLPKGQAKLVELRFFFPFLGEEQVEESLVVVRKRPTFRTELLHWPLMTPVQSSPSLKPVNELKEHEFLLYAMGPEAASYDFLTALDAVYWRGDELLAGERTRSYFVVKVKPTDNKYRFPRSMLSLTPVAVILWDDVAPAELSSDQQRAILDWVHWGGQLIVSGPSSWSRLQGSFLSPYLPVRAAESTNLATDDFAQISQTWKVTDLARHPAEAPIEVTGPPMAGLRFTLSESGEWLPGSGQMVAEAPVGRGRIVVTAFPLRDPRVFQWHYFSNFFSTGILRRHARTMQHDRETASFIQVWTAPFTGREKDPRLHSNVRLLSRDLPLIRLRDREAISSRMNDGDPSITSGRGGATELPPSLLAQSIRTAVERQRQSSTLPTVDGSRQETAPRRRGEDITHIAEQSTRPEFRSTSREGLNLPPVDAPGGEAMQWGGRGAAWNDFSGLSQEALQALRAAAGVELPSRQTMIRLLIGYLIVLVPINWLVFRVLGRLEWAWIAAPVLAGMGVVVVMKVARLDIGFARRTTEVSVLEMHGGYPRGHLTQYVALYTSLSTNYVIDFPENDAVALPLSDLSRSLRRAGSEQRRLRTTYGRAAGVRLEPLTVYSNSTELLHAEQIVEFTGALQLGRRAGAPAAGSAVKNSTTLDLYGAAILERDASDQLRMAWIGDLPAGATIDLQLEPLDIGKLWRRWAADPITQPDAPPPEALAGAETDALWIGGVLRALVHKTPLMPGQAKLFAYTNERFSKLEIAPREDQYDGRCLVVVHLTPAKLPPVRPDAAILSRPTNEEVNEDQTERLRADRELREEANSRLNTAPDSIDNSNR
ncbi:MAG: hypothetical protein KatS3mg111_3634 [Pirellulaceae bacterium]|nr:MAG: hypothetical protein KatS3mg111_3634 [Pirellulaceae bacterium]